MLEVKGSRLLLEIDDLRGVAMRRWAPLIRSSRELAQFIFFFFPNLLALVPFELLTGHDRCRDKKMKERHGGAREIHHLSVRIDDLIYHTQQSHLKITSFFCLIADLTGADIARRMMAI